MISVASGKNCVSEGWKWRKTCHFLLLSFLNFASYAYFPGFKKSLTFNSVTCDSEMGFPGPSHSLVTITPQLTLNLMWHGPGLRTTLSSVGQQSLGMGRSWLAQKFWDSPNILGTKQSFQIASDLEDKWPVGSNRRLISKCLFAWLLPLTSRRWDVPALGQKWSLL